MKKWLTFVLALALTLSAAGCSASRLSLPGGSDLMEGVAAQPGGEPVPVGGENAVVSTDFSVRLLQAGLAGEGNTLLSPVSLLIALAMTANGARGDTLAQMEEVLGMTVPELNTWLKAYREALPIGEKYQLHMANSVWFADNNGFTADREFLQTNADCYGADLYQVTFDSKALKNINAWVDENTDGMIPEILDELSGDEAMVLVNALAFDAEWNTVYSEDLVSEGVFTTEDGARQAVELMRSKEQLYLEDDHAAGFLKPYADGRYAFAALLPEKGMSVRDYVDTLTSEGLAALLAGAREVQVQAALPKFESGYSTELSELLTSMGMTDAFDPHAADFSGLGTVEGGNIYIDRVLHRTYIAVDEKGTRAGAASLVLMPSNAPLEQKEVTLDRPFIYMIIDREANLPLFLGAVMTVE